MKITHYDDHRAQRQYPDVGDQLDAIWKWFEAMYPGMTPPGPAGAMLEQIRAVKAKFPKPPNVE